MRVSPAKLTLGWALAVAWWAAAGVGVKALMRDPAPLWHGAIFGVVLGVLTLLMMHAQRSGWMPGVWDTRADLETRKQELASERERILAEARGIKNPR